MEIGTATVRLAEVVKRGKNVEITKTHVFDTPDDATKDGKVRVSDSVVAAIREGIDESGIKATDVYFVVESTKILFKSVEIPLVPTNKIQSTLTINFADYFSVDETLYHVSYVHKKTYEKNGQKMMLLDVFAVPNDLSESYYNLSVELGLNGKCLSDASRSMISLFDESFQNRNVAMVNINENSSTITIAVDGNMVFNKTIPYGVSGAIRHVINSQLTLDTTDTTGACEQFYSNNILLRHIPDGMSETADELTKLQYNATTSLLPLIKAIEQTCASFLSKADIRLQEFQLSGIGAGFSGMTNLLASAFGIPVNVVQQEGHLRINPAAATDLMLVSCYPCVGAVLDKINFFTAAEQAGGAIAQKKKIDKLFMFAGVIVCVAALGYSAYAWLQAQTTYQDVYDEHTRLTKRVEELRSLGVETAYNNWMTATSYNEQVKNLYNGTKSGNEDMVVFLEELESTLPTSSRVVSIELRPTSATVAFKCNDKYTAAGVLHLLRNLKTTNNMECPGVSEDEKTGEVSFNCTFSLKSTVERNPNEDEDEDIIGDNGDEQEPDGSIDDKLIVESTDVNTKSDISEIVFENNKFILADLAQGIIEQQLGFESSEDMFVEYNEAFKLDGIKYLLSGDDNQYINVSSDDSGKITGIGDNMGVLTFYKGLKVNMSVSDAIELLGEEVTVNNGYLIVKSDTNVIVLSADDTGEMISSIYLLDNSLFTQEDSELLEDELEIPDIDENNTQIDGVDDEI